MNIQFRLETLADYRAVEELTRKAFWNHYTPGCDEHYLVHIMRDADAFVHELDYLAICDGKIVGNIMYTEATILSDDTLEHTVLSFGPISILPEFQYKGIGTRLIEYTKRTARDLGYTAILIYGDPEIYKGSGFIPAESFSIGTSNKTYAAALLACELVDNALANCAGLFLEDKVYNIDLNLAEKFDKSFMPRAKISGLSSQLRFDELVSMNKPR